MTALVDQIVAAIEAADVSDERYVVAIAGPPAAGKSTVAAELQSALAERVAVLGLDAFHYDDAILADRGQLDRKGAPFTFDVAAYRRTLDLLRTDRSAPISIPRFDRELELTRNCAELVLPAHDVLVTEGNYLLLEEPGWAALRPLFDLTAMLDVSVEVNRSRIIERWAHFGLSPGEAVARAEVNDLPNAELVRENSAPADITATNS